VDRKISWWKNVDGSGTFAASEPMAVDTNGFFSILVHDIDGDGDTDLLLSPVFNCIQIRELLGTKTWTDAEPLVTPGRSMFATIRRASCAWLLH
jgi:hypothetical protein